MNASILTIGTEILIGQIIDSNSAWMGSKLEYEGISVQEIRSVSDDHNDIIRAVTDLLKISDLLIITGGLGPTQDDITKKTLAEFLKVDQYFDEEMYSRIQHIFKKYNLDLRESHKQQCMLPKGVKKLKNEKGTAPGMWLKNGEQIILSMPGVPYEMKSIFENEALPLVREKFATNVIFHKTIMTAGLGETTVEETIKPIIQKMDSSLSIAFLPGIRQVRVRISGKGKEQEKIKEKVLQVSNQITSALGECVFGYDDIPFAEALQNLFISKKMTLATAESCTGGHLAHLLTTIPGSSAYFLGSVISYSNKLKKQLLGVKPDTLMQFGAVSEEVATQMLLGICKTTDCDIGIAISGIAGPSGGTDQKPVGTIWLAFGNEAKIITKKLQLGKDRSTNIQYTSSCAINELRKFLLDL